ncbi:hypothetical protein [Methylocapsa sp. S129]|uniref:hypothetical protein n=1 Tax=Methylocapsa sp. S129 TaxID=1641869 RepID=UPI00131DB8AF|nr:hypothetical protein [Methylocapsa sp. S129]
MRLLYVATLLGAFGVGQASAEDNGERLLQIFEKTCAGKPVSGEALDAQARGLGYVHQNGAVAPDDLKRDPDDIHDWKLPEQGSNFALDAYFAGPRTHYRTVCGIHADNVDIAAFVERLMRETTLPQPQTKSDPKTGALSYIWTAEADGGKDTLEVDAYKNGRVRLAFSYDVIAR